VKHLLDKSSIVIVMGPGGVGKTTISAALGLAAAMDGRGTAVMTVDPARRLRDALGIERLSTRLRPLDPRRLRAARLDPSLPFAAMALESRAVWDGLVERFAGTAESRRRILANSFYQNLTGRFAGAENAAALAQLYELSASQRFGLHVVDTPPSGQAFDFIEAPAHLARLLETPSARFLFNWAEVTTGGGLRITSRLARRVVAQLEQFTGMQPLSAIAEFFSAATGATGAIVERLRAAEALLHSPASSFIVVTTTEEDRLREAREMANQITAAGLQMGAVLINRAADEPTCAALGQARRRQPRDRQALETLRALLAPDERIQGGLASLLEFLDGYQARQRAALVRAAAFASRFPETVEIALVPEIGMAVRDLSGIARLGGLIASGAYGRVFLARAAAALNPVAKSANPRQPPTRSRRT
jgi:anion-transporting  ArsA/GET3 family ATPase